jgi:Cu(I)/Ag(I) efflux system membrane fusion protein
MRKLIFASLLILIWACNPESKQNEASNESPDEASGMAESNDQTQQEIMDAHHMTGEAHGEKMVSLLNVDKRFLEQLNGLYEATVPLKEAFIESDLAKVNTEADRVIKALGKVNAELLGREAHEIWMENLMDIAHLASKMKSGTSLEEARQNFALYNKALYRSFKFLGHEGKPIYYQYCPMAFDNKGAYWLSSTEEIRNPYFGDKMLTCGSTKDVIN